MSVFIEYLTQSGISEGMLEPYAFVILLMSLAYVVVRFRNVTARRRKQEEHALSAWRGAQEVKRIYLTDKGGDK